MLPANYTFTAADNGTHSFSVTLKTAGTQSITATDTITNTITGAQTGITVNAGAATSLAVTGFPSPTTAGTSGTITVTAKDAFGNTATGYSSTVAITSSDAQAVLPANATLTNGVGTFAVTLKTVGTQSITATDTTTSTITGTQSGIQVNPGSAATFTVTGYPSPTVAGTSGNVIVTAKDAFGNVATGYSGTVAITSSDAQAVLPANLTLVNGAGMTSLTLRTPGTQSITATDRVTMSITGSQMGITVTGTAPAATNDGPYTVTTGTTLTVNAATGVLTNDTKGNPVATITANTQPAHGT